ncbi:MAG: hypothetical protein WC787_04080 [Patescibacteria group bacterium]
MKSVVWMMPFAWIIFVVLIIGASACDANERESFSVDGAQEALVPPVPCSVTAARYPTEPQDMANVYQGRTFYADGNHLGYDMLLSEGAAIHPIGCGVLRVYRAAAGYGQLVAVVEHKLDVPIMVANGLGEQVSVTHFLVIYGHIRKSQDRDGNVGLLGLAVGDMVGPDDVIGYVNDDAHNGDGGVHLHIGIRLQTMAEAQSVEAAWFRGYDSSPSRRKWFADPVPFLSTLTTSVAPVLWHPPGSFVRRPTDGSVWYVGHDASRQLVEAGTIAAEHLTTRIIDVTDAELACLSPDDPFVSPRAGHAVLKFDDSSTVYEYVLGQKGSRRAFISYEAFLSWGWTDVDVAVWSAVERDAFFADTTDQGFRLLRDGTLVKAEGQSEVSVVSEERRLPIANWSTFLALGYDAEDIVTIPVDTIDLVAGPRGPLITSELVGLCAHPSTCVDNCPPPGNGGGTGEEVSDVPIGKVRFRYDGPALPGLNQFRGMWDPPGAPLYDWVPATFATCPDTVPDDGSLECFLDAPSGTTNLLFTIQLPDGRWWGDMSCNPSGGCGFTIGNVTLEGPEGTISYDLVPNGSGAPYMNGSVAVIP